MAIKKFKESDEDEQVRKTALREVRILKVRGRALICRGQAPELICRCLTAHHITRMQQLKHDNIVNLIEVFRRKGKLHLVFEFVERTILEDLERNPDGMDPLECKKCLWQLLRSIEYCHSHNVIHRDIKPENLLLDADDNLKIADFGWSTIAKNKRQTFCGTLDYLAPEMLDSYEQRVYDKRVDTWALGVLMYECLVGTPPFEVPDSVEETHARITSGVVDFPDEPALSADAKDLIVKLLQREPSRRLGLHEVLQHPFLAEHATQL